MSPPNTNLASPLDRSSLHALTQLIADYDTQRRHYGPWFLDSYREDRLVDSMTAFVARNLYLQYGGGAEKVHAEMKRFLGREGPFEAVVAAVKTVLSRRPMSDGRGAASGSPGRRLGRTYRREEALSSGPATAAGAIHIPESYAEQWMGVVSEWEKQDQLRFF
ncbi:hypothetical protein B0A55_07267 [Friedmanniomyces simplex]|uniref:Uncharacterized protein n=1 Tax=Friedmanniomyces simplex TaxID=329884 RepID=A0A4U0X233_9PEZI|nr:hypothetical protein B0A55_07267 [Friedmanniomyces simplex]